MRLLTYPAIRQARTALLALLFSGVFLSAAYGQQNGAATSASASAGNVVVSTEAVASVNNQINDTNLELAAQTKLLQQTVNELNTVKASVKTNSLNMELLVLVFAGTLVFFMQLGFAFLESGMTRGKNTVNVLMKNFCDLCFGSLAFWCVGYGLMYGANPTGWIGTSAFFPTQLASKEAGVIFFQMMFAAAAATIVSGAIAERTRFYAYIIGSIVICAFIYPVVGSWVWGSNYGGQGWLKTIGFIDFAGSTVVHSVGGWCALAALLIVKPRLGRYANDGTPRLIQGHSLSNTLLGGLVLWVGWFGFNAGSVVAFNGNTMEDMGKIALNTHLSGCAAALGAMLALRLIGQKTMLSVIVNGAISGMVAVTAGSATVSPVAAIVIGFSAGLLTFFAQQMLDKRGLDDVVGAVSVHLVGGIWGTIAAGLFNPATYFSLAQLQIQLLGIAAVGAFAFSAAYITYRLIHAILGMRANALHEQRGLDISEHAEVGYPEFQQILLHGGAAQAQAQAAKNER